MNNQKHELIYLRSFKDQEKAKPESFFYQSLLLSSIIPDSTNKRNLPEILMEDKHAKLLINRQITKDQLCKIYHAEDHVIIGKSCMVNCMEFGTTSWEEANQEIKLIMKLGDNNSISTLTKNSEVYPIDRSRFQLLTGHMAFFALVYANGYNSAALFKVYGSKEMALKISTL